MARTLRFSFLIFTSALMSFGCASSTKPHPEKILNVMTDPSSQPSESVAPFEDVIKSYEAQDRMYSSAPGGIVFVGSSSIGRWESLQKDFEGLNVLNRGFGGSAMIDSVRYADRLVMPHQPQVVVVYAGENDIAGFGTKAEELLRHFQTFVEIVHRQLPDTRILYISIKRSPSRDFCLDEVTKANDLIREYISTDDRLGFIDVFHPMLDAQGNVRHELFIEDGVHLSPAGYDVWTKVIRPEVEAALMKIRATK
ncbi:MAG TPA: SGNH/GDSL hydrolase family protein [Tepidisphaeraceae bacterium]|nr:SGNH/GDSL hydrolase family protein [Tepidisphaeraceae bacterium]